MKLNNIKMKNYASVALVTLALASCSAPVEEEKEAVEESLPSITTIQTEKQVFDHYFEIQGAIEAEKNVIVVPEAGGLIKTLPVQEGQIITKGSTIATFDSDVIASNMKELEEQIELAQYMYDKQVALSEKGVGTEMALKQAEGQLKTLKQTLQSVKTQKGKFVLSAPFTGYIEEVFPVVGEVAGPGSPIIRLIDLTKMSVKADISESYLAKINQTSIANLSFPALGNEEIKGLNLKRVGKFVNPVNRTITVEVEIPNPDMHHVPNLMSVMRIRDYVDSNAIVIPSRTILRDVNQEPFVYVFEPGDTKESESGEKQITGHVKQVSIEIGKSSGDYTQVISGLTENEQVVDKGCRGVKDEQEVRINEKK